MRILIIAWFFPPWNEPASNRPDSWARHFAAQGHPTTVLTARKDPRLQRDLSTPLTPQPGLTVVETPLRLMRTPVAKGASWAAGSIPQARRLARQSDVIISTFGPWYMHVLGWFAKRANPAAFWCADYRDLWHARDFFMQGRPWRQAFMRRLEQFIVRPANLAVSVSPPLVASLAQTHPHIPGVTIYNGFPLSEHMPRRPPEVMRQRAVAGVPFDIVYTGTIYEGGYNDPEPLLRVLARNRWNRPVRLHFYGQGAASPLLRSLRDRYGLQESVVLPDQPLSRGDAVRRQREADLLLHLGWTNRGIDGILSAKIFEYLASGSPVLSVGAEPDTAVGRLLHETGAGICVGRNESLIESHLERYVNEGDCTAWFGPRTDRILAYTRERQAARLLELLQEHAGHD